MKLECIGKLTDKDNIKVDPRVFENVAVGATFKVSVMMPDGENDEKKSKELSPAARRLLERMENAQRIGAPEDPEELSHSKLAEERMEEKFPWLG